MSQTDEAVTRPRRIRTRLLLGLFLTTVLLGAVAGAWLMGSQWNRGQHVEAVFSVESRRSLLGDSRPLSEAIEAQELEKIRLAQLLTSPVILSQVLNDDQVAGLEMLKGRRAQLKYLQGRLYVRQEPDSDFVAIGMRGSAREIEEMKTVVDTVTLCVMDHVQRSESLKFMEMLQVLENETAKAKQLVRHLEEELRTTIAEQPAAVEEADSKYAGLQSPDVEFHRMELQQARELCSRLTERTLMFQIERNGRPTVRLVSPEAFAVDQASVQPDS